MADQTYPYLTTCRGRSRLRHTTEGFWEEASDENATIRNDGIYKETNNNKTLRNTLGLTLNNRFYDRDEYEKLQI